MLRARRSSAVAVTVVTAVAVATFALGTPSGKGAPLGIVTVQVSGSGTVTSSPPGISCPPNCAFQFSPNTTVVLSASPAGGWAFSGWGGSCSGSSPQCQLSGSSDSSVTATFTQESAPPSPAISIGDVSVTEGNSGTTNAVVTASVSPVPGEEVSVSYATENGSAGSEDYGSASGTLRIPAGAATATISVPIRGDSVDEPDETLFLKLSSPDRAVIADGEALITIVDDDLPDADRDGFPPPADCNDANAAVHPGATEIPGNAVDENCDGVAAPLPDADRDGFPTRTDCNDRNAAIHPGAREIPGNAVDENCDGVAAPFPRLGASILARWHVARASTRVRRLDAINVPGGSTVVLTCSGGRRLGCAFRTERVSVRSARARVELLSFFHGAELKPGAVIEIRITKPATIGAHARYTVRRGRAPHGRALCLPPGATRPVSC